MKHHLLVILTAAAVALATFASACNGDSGSTPTAPSNQTPAFTPTADNGGSPEPSPKVEPVPERTGDEALDAIIEGFMQQDTKNLLLPNLRYQTLPCRKTSGIGELPICRPDQDEGTPTEVMPVSACEYGLYRPHEFEKLLPEYVKQDIYGVYRATPEVRFPGDYVIVLTQPQPDDPAKEMGTEVAVKDGRIVAVDQTCALTPEEAIEQDGLGEPLYVP